MTAQRDLVRASLDRPDYRDRCAIPRRPMTPREAAAAFLNSATSAARDTSRSTPPPFSVNRSTYGGSR